MCLANWVLGWGGYWYPFMQSDDTSVVLSKPSLLSTLLGLLNSHLKGKSDTLKKGHLAIVMWTVQNVIYSNDHHSLKYPLPTTPPSYFRHLACCEIANS